MSGTLEEIDAQLQDAILRERRATKLARDVGAVRERIATNERDVVRLRAAHAREHADVEALAGAGIRKLLAMLRGDLQERLSAEEAEAAQAATDLAHARDLLAADRARLTELRDELATLGSPDRDLAALRARKEQLLPADSTLAQQLSEVGEQHARTAADLREVDEAIAAGEDCLRHLRQAGELLRRAAGWSTWDVLGGGSLVTLQKQSLLTDARSAGSAAAASLHRFADELADVRADVASAPRVELGSWDLTFDVWFDNIFTDLRIDGLIRTARTDTDRTVQRVTAHLADLGRARTELAAELTELDERRRVLLDPPVW